MKLKLYYFSALFIIFAVCIAVFGKLSSWEARKDISVYTTNELGKQDPVINSYSFDSITPNYFDHAVKPETVSPSAPDRNVKDPLALFTVIFKSLDLINIPLSKAIIHSDYFFLIFDIPVYILYRKLII